MGGACGSWRRAARAARAAARWSDALRLHAQRSALARALWRLCATGLARRRARRRATDGCAEGRRRSLARALAACAAQGARRGRAEAAALRGRILRCERGLAQWRAAAAARRAWPIFARGLRRGRARRLAAEHAAARATPRHHADSRDWRAGAALRWELAQSGFAVDAARASGGGALRAAAAADALCSAPARGAARGLRQSQRASLLGPQHLHLHYAGHAALQAQRLRQAQGQAAYLSTR